MTASGLEMLAARLNSGDMQALQALQAFAGLMGPGAYRAPGHEQAARVWGPDTGGRLGRPRRPGSAWRTSDKIPREESDEEQEIAEALFDLANVAAMATASEQPQPARSDALHLEAGAVEIEAGAEAATVPLKVEGTAARLHSAAAAADAADPVEAMTGMVSPRKRQRKPNRNLVLYEGFAEDEDEEEEAAAGYQPAGASRRGGHGGGRGGRGGRGGGKMPRLDNALELVNNNNYANWPAAGAGAGTGAGPAARDASTADSRDMSQRGQASGSGGAGPRHPVALERAGVKRTSQVYIAHFIDWHKAKQTREHPTGRRADRELHQQAQQAAGQGYAHRQQQQQQQQHLAQQHQLSDPSSPSSRFQQLLSNRGLAGAAAGLFAGAQPHGLPAPLPPPSLLERHGPPGSQPPVTTAALMAGGYNLGPAGAAQQGGYGGMLPGAQAQQPAANGLPLGLNGLPAIRTHPAGFPGGRGRQAPPPPPQQQQQAPLGAPGYLQAGAGALKPPAPAHPFMQQGGPVQMLPGHLLPGAGATSHTQQGDVSHLLSLLMNHSQQMQQGLAGLANGGMRGGGGGGGGWGGGWPAQQAQHGGRSLGLPLQQQALAAHQQQQALQQQQQQQHEARLLLQQQLRQAQQAVLAQQQRGAGPPQELQPQAQQGTATAAAPMSKLALNSDAERTLRTLQQALLPLAKYGAAGRISEGPGAAAAPRGVPVLPGAAQQQQRGSQSPTVGAQRAAQAQALEEEEQQRRQPPSTQPAAAQSPRQGAGAEPQDWPLSAPPGAAPEAAEAAMSPPKSQQAPSRPPSTCPPGAGGPPAIERELPSEPVQQQPQGEDAQDVLAAAAVLGGSAPTSASEPGARAGGRAEKPARQAAASPAPAGPQEQTEQGQQQHLQQQAAAAAQGGEPPQQLASEGGQAARAGMNISNSSMMSTFQNLVKASFQQAVNGDHALQAQHAQQGPNTRNPSLASLQQALQAQQAQREASPAPQVRGHSPALAQHAQHGGALPPGRQAGPGSLASSPYRGIADAQQQLLQQATGAAGELLSEPSRSPLPRHEPTPPGGGALPLPAALQQAFQQGAGAGVGPRDMSAQAQLAQLLMSILPKQMADSTAVGQLGQGVAGPPRGPLLQAGGPAATLQHLQQQASCQQQQQQQ